MEALRNIFEIAMSLTLYFIAKFIQFSPIVTLASMLHMSHDLAETHQPFVTHIRVTKKTCSFMSTDEVLSGSCDTLPHAWLLVSEVL